MVACTGIEYVKGDCMNRAEYETNYMPGYDKPYDFILWFMYCSIVPVGGLIAEKECNNATTVERG